MDKGLGAEAGKEADAGVEAASGTGTGSGSGCEACFALSFTSFEGAFFGALSGFTGPTLACGPLFAAGAGYLAGAGDTFLDCGVVVVFVFIVGTGFFSGLLSNVLNFGA